MCWKKFNIYIVFSDYLKTKWIKENLKSENKPKLQHLALYLKENVKDKNPTRVIIIEVIMIIYKVIIIVTGFSLS